MAKTNVKIIKMGINGEGIGYINKLPVFVEGALVDETAEIEMIEKNPNYAKAVATKIIHKSNHRVKSPCVFQEKCGGCSLMVCDYQKQLELKRDLLKESLNKYAGIRDVLIEDVVANPSPLHYRNQCKLPVKWLKGTLHSGMYEAGSSRLIYMDECKVHEKELDVTRKKIMNVLNKYELRDYNDRIERGIRHFVLRGFDGKYQCTLVTGRMTIEEEVIADILKIDGVVSLYQNINISKKNYEIFGKELIHLGGSKTIELRMSNVVARLSPMSFFQLNVKQAENLYNTVVSCIEPCDTIVEAYSGIGLMSLLLKDKANKIIGIECIKDAVKNANNNARINHCEDKVQFICGDAAEEFTKISKREKVDVLLVDPPRAGLDDEMIECILKSRPKQIVYVSCNPSTLSKNLNKLQKLYKVDRIIPFDVFSHTPHVESVVILSYKK